MTNIEPLLNPIYSRFEATPINPLFAKAWDFKKVQEKNFWTADEVDFSNDRNDITKLPKDTQFFIKNVLAFFMRSDGIVGENISENFVEEVTPFEVKAAYRMQGIMEDIHNEIYSNMFINLIADDEKETILKSIDESPSLKGIEKWALKWSNRNSPFGQRVIAFAIFEGVFFSGAFAAIFWLRENYKGKMQGLIESNLMIMRDEGLHTEFACYLYSLIVDKIEKSVVHEMIDDAMKLIKNFTSDSLKCELIGMNQRLMNQYLEYVADRLLVSLGYDKLYKSTSPFSFMENVSYDTKTNFFERRNTNYQKYTKNNSEFMIDVSKSADW